MFIINERFLMNKATVLGVIANFDALQDSQKKYGDTVIRTHLYEWVNSKGEDAYLKFSHFLGVHQGPLNFNQYISIESYFNLLFYRWQEHNAHNYNRTTITTEIIPLEPVTPVVSRSIFRQPNEVTEIYQPRPPSQ
jgi:hypothetical protein